MSTHHPTWSAVASGEHQRDRAQQIAIKVARNLQRLREGHAPTSRWCPASVAEGDAGLALVCGYVGDCVDDPAWSVTAHRLLQSAARDAQESAPTLPGLFSGLAGLGFAASALSHNGTRYRRLLASVDTALCDYLHPSSESPLDDGYVPSFDVVSGLSGIGAYFLQRAHEPAALSALTTVLDLLVDTAGRAEIPLQWSTPAIEVEEPLRQWFPEGYVNCGLAHGVPGPLAFLAQARLKGVQSRTFDAAIEAGVTWLVANRTDDAWGPNWPLGVPMENIRNPGHGRINSARPARTAWCYGVPGVARALWLAGVAMDRPDWRRVSVDAMGSVYRRPMLADIRSPGLCHGLGGLLQITLRFYHDTRDDEFAVQARVLIDELIDRFEPDSRFGFRDYGSETDIDNPDFLNGAAGVAATLLAASSDIAPNWDQVLLLA